MSIALALPLFRLDARGLRTGGPLARSAGTRGLLAAKGLGLTDVL